MATTDSASSFPSGGTSEPSAPVQGQSTSKAARTRRNRAAKKEALLKDLNDATSSTDQAVLTDTVDITKKATQDQDTNLTLKILGIIDTGLSASASASLPKQPLPVKNSQSIISKLEPTNFNVNSKQSSSSSGSTYDKLRKPQVDETGGIIIPFVEKDKKDRETSTNPVLSKPPTSLSFSSTSKLTDVPPQPKTSVKQPSQSSPSPIIDQVFDNLLVIIRPQRQALLQGPRITIHVGDTSVANIFKRAAMAASSVLHKHFTVNPESLEYSFSRGQIYPGAVRFLLIDWMQETCNEFEAYAVPAQKTFGEDVAILRAARLLGMERYCRHLLIGYVDYLKTQLPSYEEIIAVEQNATSDKDPLWTAMVNHLCHDRFRGLIPDVEDFEEFLEKHSQLKKAMESADNFFASYAKKQAEGREKERRLRWEQNQAEKRERIAKEQLAAESLRKKLDRNGSGLMTITADEAEVLQGRHRTH